MGASSSSLSSLSHIDPQLMEELKMTAYASTDEINKLWNEFQARDVHQSGAISLDDFLEVKYFSYNPLAVRIFHLLDTQRQNSIDFRRFVEGVSVFSINAPRMKKLQFLFRLFDSDADGKISSKELIFFVQNCLGRSDEYLSIEDQSILVNKTLEECEFITGKRYPLLSDAAISFEDFLKVIDVDDAVSKMNIEFD